MNRSIQFLRKRLCPGLLLTFLATTPCFAQAITFTETDLNSAGNPVFSTLDDVNNDGALDLLVVLSSGGVVSVRLGNGAGGFLAPTYVLVGLAPPTMIALGDLNRDGKDDMVVAYDSGPVAALFGNGSGGFGSPQAIAAPSGPRSVALADFDGDGDLDLAAAGKLSNTMTVSFNNGAGVFATGISYATGTYPLSIAAGNLNGDCLPDLVVADQNSADISVFMNDGSGGFGTRTAYAIAGVPHQAALGDVNGDQKLDIVTANAGSTVSVLLGNGTGGFAPKVDYPTGFVASSVAITYMNADAFSDLIVPHDQVSGMVSVLLGGSGGSFNHVDVPTQSGSVWAAVGDLDGNRVNDLAVACASAGMVAILRNQTIGPVFSTITAKAGPGGQIRPSGKVQVPLGGNFTFSVFTMDSCTEVADLTVDGASAGATSSYTFTNVTSDHTMDVTFTGAMLSGRKFSDLDASGGQNGTEPGLSGWTIQLDPPYGPTTTTNANGDYSFEPVTPGPHVIAEVQQSGWSITAPARGSHWVQVNACDPITGLDFGNCNTPQYCKSRANHLLNGSFEGSGIPNFVTIGPSNPSPIPGWYVTTGNIQWVGPYWSAKGGSRSVDLDGDQAGDLRQDFSVTPGQSYVLSFYMAGNTDGGPSIKDVRVEVLNGVNQILSTTRSFNTTGYTPGNLGWRLEAVTFTIPAGVSSATVAFTSLTAGAFGPAIDSVAVRDTCLGEIHGTKFRDDNVDGVRLSPEPGLASWTFVLNGPVSGTEVTDGAGDYAFKGLPPGNYTVTEVLKPNWKIVAPVSGAHSVAVSAGAVLGKDFGNCELQDCVKPPAGMVAWWNMDDLGSIAKDVVGPNHGTWVPSPAWVGGKVGQGASISPSQFITVPSNGTLNAFNNFSIDAWVRVPTGPYAGPVAVVSKLDKIAMRGYLLEFGPTRFEFLLADGGTTSLYPHPGTFTPGVWYHIAVVVDRTAGEVTTYLNGTPDIKTLTSSNAVGNTTALTIGSPSLSTTYHELDVDEIEIFRSAITSEEVQRLYQAGAAGKSRNVCYVPSLSTYTRNGNQVKVCMNITNASPTMKNYSWSLNGLPVGPGCDVPGPTIFNAQKGNVWVGANSTKMVCVTITRPGGLSGAQQACYELVISDTDQHRCFTCSGKLAVFRIAGVMSERIDRGTYFVGPGATQEISIVLKNDGGTSGARTYAIRPLPTTGDSADMKLSLNGLPPGTPVVGSVNLAPGDSAVVTVLASYPGGDIRYPMDELRVELDQDGDGISEVVQAYGVMSGTEDPLDVASPPQASRIEFSIHPNPFTEKATILLALPVAEHVGIRIFDLAGREIRTLVDGRLPAGRNSIDWDGRDGGGRRVSSGVYFVQVARSGQTSTRRFVRLD